MMKPSSSIRYRKLLKASACFLLPSLGVIVAVLVSSGYPKSASISEGAYQLCREVSGFSGETLELKGGHFRYWFYSDVGGVSTRYPLSGHYSIRGDKLILEVPELRGDKRTISTVNGIAVLWRDDGLAIWNAQKKVQPYAILIKNPEPMIGDQIPDPPSLKLLQDRR